MDYAIDYWISFWNKFLNALDDMKVSDGVSLLAVLIGCIVVVTIVCIVFSQKGGKQG